VRCTNASRGTISMQITGQNRCTNHRASPRKTRIVVMTTKEPEVLGSCASRYRARLFCGRRRFLSCFLRNFL